MDDSIRESLITKCQQLSEGWNARALNVLAWLTKDVEGRLLLLINGATDVRRTPNCGPQTSILIEEMLTRLRPYYDNLLHEPTSGEEADEVLYVQSNRTQFRFPICSYYIERRIQSTFVRLIPEANWINDRDQFLAPKDEWADDELFQTDCLTYAIFNTKNNVRSADGTNHWQPFTEKQLGLTQALPSHFMTDFMAGKAKCFSIPPFSHFANKKLTFSDTAQAVFDAALPLWQYYHAQPDANLNASYYDIREYFCKRDKKGRLNSKSTDEKYNQLHEELRKTHRELGRHIEPKIYEYEFLIR